MATSSTSRPHAPHIAQVSAISNVVVGPGCYRSDLPGGNGVRAWVVEIEPGAQWPYVDKHGKLGEIVFVISGELIEGQERYGPGTYIAFGPFSEHRPRSERGVKLFGINPI